MKIIIKKGPHILKRVIWYYDNKYLNTGDKLYIHIINPIKLLRYGIKYPIMHWFNKKSRVYECECGHDFDTHHHGIIANPNSTYLPRQINGILGQECEYNGFNGYIEPDENGYICKCNSYVDKGWIFKLNKNYKYRINWKNLKNYVKTIFLLRQKECPTDRC